MAAGKQSDNNHSNSGEPGKISISRHPKMKDMMNKLLEYWNNLILTGSDMVISNHIRRKVILSNQISLSFFVLGIPILLMFICVIKQILIIYIVIIVLLVCLTIPIMNKAGLNTASRITTCLFATCVAGMSPLISKILYPEAISMNMYYGPRMFLLSCLTVPLLLIDFSEKRPLIFCLLVNAFFLFAFDFIDQLFGVSFHQMGFKTIMYYNINFYVLINFLFLLSALLYLQYSNRKFEREIIQLNKNLDARVKEKTREIEDANLDLKAFNYTVSHELKMPLTAAQMLSQTTLKLYGNQLGETGKKHLITIDNCMVEMQELIKNIMIFSRLGGQEKKTELLDMNKIAAEVVEELSNVNSGNYRISVRNLPEVYGDRTMIKLVLTNLLSNAIKYSREKSEPVIEISGLNKIEEIVYSVKDNGIGFDMKDIDKIFQLFERLHSKTTYQGSGVGLAIASRIIERHGGNIWAKSNPGQGAEFFFSLPSS